MLHICNSFNSYEEAMELSKIPSTMCCLHVVHHKDSLESVVQGGNIVYIIGKGSRKTPGFPSANQQYNSQDHILHINGNTQKYFPIVYTKNDKVHFLGTYVLDRMRKKLSKNGFSYFEYRMRRVFNTYSYVEAPSTT